MNITVRLRIWLLYHLLGTALETKGVKTKVYQQIRTYFAAQCAVHMLAKACTQLVKYFS